LLQTEITQPAVLATDQGITQVLAAYGMRPDMVMGHSLGEYGALVAAGSLTFEAALEAVSARGREMAALSVDDNGAMAAVFGPLPEIERIVAETPGYVVVANINSNNQAVVGGATAAVTQAIEHFAAPGCRRCASPSATPSTPRSSSRRRCPGGDPAPPRRPAAAHPDRGQRDRRVLSVRRDQRDDARDLGKQVSSPVQFVRASTRCTTPVPGCSSRWARSAPCTVSSVTSSATTTTSSHCSRTTRSSATWPR
jgi:hypothetical protein